MSDSPRAAGTASDQSDQLSETEPARQRVRLATVAQVALLLVAFGVIARGVARLDLEDLLDQLADARWWLVVFGLLVAQAPRVTSAVSSIGAAPVPVPLGPMYLLQLALSYIGLAVPGSAARFAVNVRFFQKKDMAAGTAVAASALDSAVWFAVLGAQLGLLLVLTEASLELELGDSTSSGLTRLVVIVVGLGVAALAVLALVPKWRRVAVTRVREFIRDARLAARGVTSPRRLAMLLGGNLGSAFLFAITLEVFAASLGHSVGFVEALFIHVSVALLAGILPVPGGIGVVEAGLTYGLARAGVPEDAAFATAIMFRISTFYLPPAWGVVALRWLERNHHL